MIELYLVLKILLRRWYVIVIPSVIVMLLTLPALLGDTPSTKGGFTTVMRYTAGQELGAIPGRQGDYQDVWLASELTVNAFTEWVRTFSFAEEIAALTNEKGLEIDPTALNIAADNERSIGQIFISWGEKIELGIIADAAIEVLRTRNQAYFPQLGDAPAQVELLDDVHISPVPPSLPNRFRPLLQILLGFSGGVGLAFVLEFIDPVLRSRYDLEMTGVRIIGAIPRQ